jgi:hypothetical protein
MLESGTARIVRPYHSGGKQNGRVSICDWHGDLEALLAPSKVEVHVVGGTEQFALKQSRVVRKIVQGR